ncbi:MAG: PAS domain S-box protein [Eubacteriales bacterium]
MRNQEKTLDQRVCHGVVVHIAMLCCAMFLPYPQNLEIIRKIALPIMLIYPTGSFVLSMLLVRQMDHKSLQERLEQSEERFKMLFNQAPLGYQSLDENGTIIEVNHQWLSMLGYERDEVIGKWFGDFVAPGFRSSFISRFPDFNRSARFTASLACCKKTGRIYLLPLTEESGIAKTVRFCKRIASCKTSPSSG